MRIVILAAAQAVHVGDWCGCEGMMQSTTGIQMEAVETPLTVCLILMVFHCLGIGRKGHLGIGGDLLKKRMRGR